MPRDVTSGMVTALSAGSLQVALFVQCQFGNETVYIWSGLGALSFGGDTYLGVGTLGNVSTVEEVATVTAKGITLSLSGIDPLMLAEVLGDYSVGLPCIVMLGCFDSSGALIDGPITTFSGRMDQPTITISGTEATISIAAESRLIDMNSSTEMRYTNEQAQINHPGDRGFEFVNQIQGMTIVWGQSGNVRI